MTTYYGAPCPLCGTSDSGVQLESHPADTYFVYACSACGRDHDGREKVSQADWDAIQSAREAYDEEEAS